MLEGISHYTVTLCDSACPPHPVFVVTLGMDITYLLSALF